MFAAGFRTFREKDRQAKWTCLNEGEHFLTLPEITNRYGTPAKSFGFVVKVWVTLKKARKRRGQFMSSV